MPLPNCAVISGVHWVTHFKVRGSDSYVIHYRHVRLLSGRVVYLKLVEAIYLYTSHRLWVCHLHLLFIIVNTRFSALSVSVGTNKIQL